MDADDRKAFGAAVFSDAFYSVKRIKEDDPMTIIQKFHYAFFRCFPKNHLAGYQKFGEYVGRNTHLQKLELLCCGLGPESFTVFCQDFVNNRSIRSLGLEGNRFFTAGMQSLSPFIENNPSLRELVLSDNDFDGTESLFADEGTRVLSRALRQRNINGHPNLTSIYLWGNAITDEGIEELVSVLLQHNPSLKILDLCCNEFGTAGCTALAGLLSDDSCALEMLNVKDNVPYIFDAQIVILAESLRNNTILKEINLEQSAEEGTSEPPVTSIGLTALLNLVCNGSSFNSTYYQSNHTITTFGEDVFACRGYIVDERGREVDHPMSATVERYLKLNASSSDKKCVARRKVLCRHFSGNFSLGPIIDIDNDKILVHLVAWFANVTDGGDYSEDQQMMIERRGQTENGKRERLDRERENRERRAEDEALLSLSGLHRILVNIPDLFLYRYKAATTNV